MASKVAFINPTFNTPIAITIWNRSPIPTVFQLIAFRFELKSTEINIREIIPKAPRQILLNEIPWLGIICELLVSISKTVAASMVSACKLYVKLFSESVSVLSVSCSTRNLRMLSFALLKKSTSRLF